MDRDLETVRRIVDRFLEGIDARVYLYGSRARGDHRFNSDIDVAIMPSQPLSRELMVNLEEALEESDILVEVDLVDLSRTGAAFRERVLAQGVLWRS